MRRLIAITVVACTLLVAASTVAAQDYQIVVLPDQPGAVDGSAFEVNNQNQVVGFSGAPVFWESGSAVPQQILPDKTDWRDFHLNDLGQVAGMRFVDEQWRPFLWQNGQLSELPLVPGATHLWELTNSGFLLYAGDYDPATGEKTWVIAGQTVFPVWNLLGVGSSVWTMNDSGLLGGYLQTANGYPAVLRYPNGRIVKPIGDLSSSAVVLHVGDGGHYLGVDSTSTRYFYAGPDAPLREVVLPASARYLSPSNLNRYGDVVGWLEFPGPDYQAFIYRNNTLRNLRDVVPGWRIQSAGDINDNGVIAAWAENLTKHQRHAVLLLPQTVPTDIQATVVGTHVTLSWQAPPAAVAGTTYRLQVGTAPDIYNLLDLNIGPVTSISGSAPFGTLYYRLTAVMPSGTPGTPSSEQSFVVAPPAIPEAPAGLSASVVGHSVTLSWTAPPGSGPFQYVLEAGSQTGAANLFNGSIGAATALSATVPPGVYFVRVRAKNAAGVGPASAEVVVTIQP